MWDPITIIFRPRFNKILVWVKSRVYKFKPRLNILEYLLLMQTTGLVLQIYPTHRFLQVYFFWFEGFYLFIQVLSANNIPFFPDFVASFLIFFYPFLLIYLSFKKIRRREKTVQYKWWHRGKKEKDKRCQFMIHLR